MLYQLTNLYINNYEIPRQLRILLNRSLLLIIVVGLYVAHIISKKKLTFYNHKPKWNILIEMPYHSIKLSYFMIIGLVISGVTFTPFILQQEISYLKSILFFCMLFSIINATLEELIWRGIVLSTLKRYVSVIYALAITSLGFGLLHIILGIPLIVCVLFSVGGLFYGFVVIKTNSIYPAILFHMVINIGMVFSGFIL
jgi:membrane protease YdiL (CAAX protease family)